MAPHWRLAVQFQQIDNKCLRIGSGWSFPELKSEKKLYNEITGNINLPRRVFKVAVMTSFLLLNKPACNVVLGTHQSGETLSIVVVKRKIRSYLDLLSRGGKMSKRLVEIIGCRDKTSSWRFQLLCINVLTIFPLD